MIRFREQLDLQLPDERITSDAKSVIHECAGRVELGGRMLTIPSEASYHVLSKRCEVFSRDDIGFGNHMRGVVVIGAVTVTHGIADAGVCFVTLWYNETMNLITADFTQEMP